MSAWTAAGAGIKLPTDMQLTIQPVTPAQRQAARIAVCEKAHDAEDAALLLEALGLLEVES